MLSWFTRKSSSHDFSDRGGRIRSRGSRVGTPDRRNPNPYIPQNSSLNSTEHVANTTAHSSARNTHNQMRGTNLNSSPRNPPSIRNTLERSSRPPSSLTKKRSPQKTPLPVAFQGNDEAEIHRQITLTASVESELKGHSIIVDDQSYDDEEDQLPPMGGSRTPPPNSSPKFLGLSKRPKKIQYSPPKSKLPSSQRKNNRRSSMESAAEVMKMMGPESAKKAKAFRRRSISRGNEDDYQFEYNMGEIGKDIETTPPSTRNRSRSRSATRRSSRTPQDPSSLPRKKSRSPTKKSRNSDITRAREQLHPPSGINRTNSVAEAEHHHVYPPRLLTDIFASHQFLSTILPGIPGCLRCVLAKTRGESYPEKCQNPVAGRVGDDWSITSCYKVKKAWNERLIALRDTNLELPLGPQTSTPSNPPTKQKLVTGVTLTSDTTGTSATTSQLTSVTSNDEVATLVSDSFSVQLVNTISDLLPESLLPSCTCEVPFDVAELRESASHMSRPDSRLDIQTRISDGTINFEEESEETEGDMSKTSSTEYASQIGKKNIETWISDESTTDYESQVEYLLKAKKGSGQEKWQSEKEDLVSGLKGKKYPRGKNKNKSSI